MKVNSIIVTNANYILFIIQRLYSKCSLKQGRLFRIKPDLIQYLLIYQLFKYSILSGIKYK